MAFFPQSALKSALSPLADESTWEMLWIGSCLRPRSILTLALSGNFSNLFVYIVDGLIAFGLVIDFTALYFDVLYLFYFIP